LNEENIYNKTLKNVCKIWSCIC